MITERLFDKRNKTPHVELQEHPSFSPLKEQPKSWWERKEEDGKVDLFPLKETWPKKMGPELHGLRVYHKPSEQMGKVNWHHADKVGLQLIGGKYLMCHVDEVSVLDNQ